LGLEELTRVHEGYLEESEKLEETVGMERTEYQEIVPTGSFAPIIDHSYSLPGVGFKLFFLSMLFLISNK